MGTILEIKNLLYSFGGNKAVNEASFAVEEGSITGLIGPNGAGKTTTFNCIAGLLKPSGGRIVFLNKETTSLPPNRIYNEFGIHRTFQIPAPFASMSVLENVMSAKKRQAGEHLFAVFTPGKVRREEKEAYIRANEVIELVGLKGYEYNLSSELSGGQRKLLEIARALFDHPKILLLDEPTAGVNPTLGFEICEKLRLIAQKSRLSIFMISHDMASVQRLCERVVVMDRGKVLTEGSPKEVMNSKEVQEIYLGYKG